MEKVLVTSDIHPQFRQVMKTLTLFDKTEVIVVSEMMQDKHDVTSLINQIITFAPTLIITRSKEITNYIISYSNQSKVILLANCGKDCDRLFLSNALVLSAFMNSREKIFEIK